MAGQGKQTSAERRKERQAAARAEAAKKRRKQRIQVLGGGGALVAVVAIVAIVVSLVHNGGSNKKDNPNAVPSPAPTADQSGVPAGQFRCIYEDSPNPVAAGAKNVGKPPELAENATPQYATMATNHGTVEIELDAKAAPCAVNSFTFLASKGYFDNTTCHRLLDSSSDALTYAVLQCGDPTGTGRGGPGYKFADEALTGARYAKGVIAMANAGPNTNGSQFFMMFKDSSFDPSYTPFGKILSGVEVIEKIAKGGLELNPETQQNDVPKTKTTITKVTISSTPPKGIASSTAKPTSTPSSTAKPTPSSTAKPTPSSSAKPKS
ncbi:MAG TPA: peptidylprolyl isomerase [Sporichthyaceae bacterium]|nr:peptidylprolyl isomerase [Sporichthyaceae bacterium]